MVQKCLGCGKVLLSSYKGRVQKMRCDRCYARNRYRMMKEERDG